MTLGFLIDTSSEFLILAIIKDAKIEKKIIQPHDNHLSKNLLIKIQELFSSSKLSLKNLQYIALGIGPGSYTGTRLGASIAKSLSFALTIPLIDFPSPLVFLEEENGSVAAVIASKASDFFCLFFDIDKEEASFFFSLKKEALDALLDEKNPQALYYANNEKLPFTHPFKPFSANLDLAAKLVYHKFRQSSYKLLEEPPKLLYLNPHL